MTLFSVRTACRRLPLSLPAFKAQAAAFLRCAFRRRSPIAPWDGQELVREELFSVERLEEHARSLAGAQSVTLKLIKGHALAGRLADNAAALLEAYRDSVQAVEQARAVTPAAEWLIDNYHLVERQIREIRADLPPGYYRQLPKLAAGPFAGYPRVFGMTWAYVAHTDSRFDPESMIRYVRAYQEVQPLTIGELWAAAITLRIVLIENLRRVAGQTVSNRRARQQADDIADRLLGLGVDAAEPASAVLVPHERGRLSEAFAVQLAHRLRDQDPSVTPALTWLDQRLAQQGTTADAAVRDVHRRQGAANVTMRNIITSLRLISDVDWTEAFEQVSLVDGVLAAGGAFKLMDFPTRNLYRSAIEALARGSDHTELDIARAAVKAAAATGATVGAATDDRRADPGYHLIGGERGAFEAAVGFRPPWRQWASQLNRRLGVAGYAGAIGAVAALILAAPLLILIATDFPAPGLALLGALGALPAIDAATALVNRAVTYSYGAMLLPGLELRDGVPSHLRTLVAVPTLLTGPDAVEEQIERLEIHHLASPDGDLHFALLSDWPDADSEHADGDEALTAAAAAGIARLNLRYGPGRAGPRFLLLHRRRVWNAGEGRWIGWERKRGKLHELNRLLRGAADTTFMDIDGAPPAPPPGVRYVVTLDADTKLPRDAVRRLIGKMAHPLNRPRFDQVSGRVVEGYAVLQPRVTPSLPMGREGSLFQRIFSSISGIDPYASAVSDVYQDLFGEGSYVGKGVYDVDAFEAALAGRAPDSTLLSHDLFEGMFARAGLASDVEVVEEYPARYDVGALRHHRWARGDWQLLPWVLGAGPGGGDSSIRAIPAVGRWKMVDNLRRTLSAPATLVALAVGWTMPLAAAAWWTAFILAAMVLPTLIPVIAAVPPRRPEVTLASHARALLCDMRLAGMLTALNVTFLAHQTHLMGDAIIRTLWRLYVSRRHLLEWVPAAQAGGASRLNLFGCYARMAGAPIIAAATGVLVWTAASGAWPAAVPFLLLWLASPAVALWVSRSPPDAGRLIISEADALILRLTARRTWRYFETFVTVADHGLPPDNFQEAPAPALAHRTSPTNLGLYLLSVASARDFGWIGVGEAVERLTATLATMSRLARFRGHFYNWYDTRDLRPLDPHYISSVDSGNLAGHLIALANACREWRSLPLDPARRLAGIADAAELARIEASLRLRDGRRTQTATWDQLDDGLAGLIAAAREPVAAGEETTARLILLSARAETMIDIARALVIERGDGAGDDMLFWAEAVLPAIDGHRRDCVAPSPDAALVALENAARAMAMAMDFAFLLDRERKLLSIGYRTTEGALDANCYDLLASEARLASFFAIAKGDVPARHWFRLGRAATPVAHGAALISWSGSMFEYLMPSLVMRAPAGSLLEQTNRLIVRRQIDYGTALGLPWGISESAYNVRDIEFTYQYSNFGVPGLGLKRGLGQNRVIAPYATALAAMVDPQAATANLAWLAAAGGRGRYGYYEALDYTADRVAAGDNVAVVRAFMAHHQGMTIVAVADALFDGIMRSRFHAEPMVQATELLLQERMPRDVSAAHSWAAEVQAEAATRVNQPAGVRHFTDARQAAPATLLLSNGRYAAMLTAAGSGYSRWGDIAVTRWREDATCDDYGSYVFIRDVRSGAVWSAGFQPTGVEPDRYAAAFHEDHAEFTRDDGPLTTAMDVLVSAEDDAEVRRITVSNSGPRLIELEITSYIELALSLQAADVAHPAFSKLFIETEYLADVGAILATRRRRSPTEPEIWAAHLAVVDGECVGKPEIETDRARFLGRGHSLRTPIAVIDGRPLSNTVGAVLDPIFALRRRVRVPPGGMMRIAFWTMIASDRAALLDAIDRHRDAAAYARATMLAWTQAQVQLHHLGVTAGDAGLFQRLAGHVIYAAPTLRPASSIIRAGGGAQSGLWGQGISGDLPIVLLRIADIENLDVARELLKAHEYWRMKRLAVDLVILNERQASYVQDLQAALETLARVNRPPVGPGQDGTAGRVYVLRADLIPADVWALLSATARIVLSAQRGGLFEQLDRAALVRPAMRFSSPTRFSPTPVRDRPVRDRSSPDRPDLEFFNGLGGFAKDGAEYVTILGPGQATPAPWINVVANPAFGFQATAEGGGCTWSVSSRERLLTPWSNDPVTDRSGEAFYLRDEDDGAVWTPTAAPMRRDAAVYVARHGRGYSRFEHTAHGIAADLLQFVPLDGSIKISRLSLRNQTDGVRRLSVTAYVEWVLGPSRSASLGFVATDLDTVTGALFARNPWGAAFGARVAFLDMAGAQSDWTGDRGEFIGRNGSPADPQAPASGGALSKRGGAGLDPCGVLQTKIELPPGGAAEIVVFLGDAPDAAAAVALIERFRAADLDGLLQTVADYWDGVLGAVQVRTPDRSMDIMLNGRLLYQTLACRIWARAAFYQAGGAYGFRDQLQDGMALATAAPALTREHLLRAAGRQFAEGDVQHWWLPHTGQGVRTRISDDRVWLAYAVCHYVDVTGDAEVLDVEIPFLDGQTLPADETENFFQPTVSDRTATLYEHFARALDQSLALGGHGLPLIGAGDWNDGMNRVGAKGAGESVWLGWFLYKTLTQSAPLAEARGETARAAVWRAHAAGLQASLEREAWDGDWYRRGFYDDGAPLGSVMSKSCRIDSIAQSWAVLSGAAAPERAAQAMASLERELIRPDDRLALLFTPPFDPSSHDTGYVQGYPPGVRENGGQYTHAALWSVMAFAAQGDGDKAAGLFSLLNPINHARTRADALRYRVEPYAVAADVYAAPPHVGRGGWTWYTGSAGWMQRAGIESILGLRLSGGFLFLDPCIPRAWPGFHIALRHGSARYEIHVDNVGATAKGVAFAAVDGVEITERPLRFKLADDGLTHKMEVRLG
jgi:cyclic beta-1,2-glucan synthetase